MAVTTLTGDHVVELQIAATQAAATANIDASEGSVTLALAQGVRGVFLWLQALFAQAVAKANLLTSFGPDVDSWIGQIGMVRIAAQSASGSVTVARRTAGVQAVIPIGAHFSTGPGGTQFTVTADSANAGYSASLGGYLISAGAASINVPVACTTGGQAGNVQAGTIRSFVTPIPYIDTVTNPIAFSNGVASELDAAVKSRVPLYVKGLRSATDAAILSAALAVQQGIKLVLHSAYPTPGFYTLYADDGSGAAPDSFIGAVYAAAASVTAEGVQPSVTRPTLVPVSITGTLLVSPGTSPTLAGANAAAAVAAYIAALPISDGTGAGYEAGILPYLSIPGVVTAADGGIVGLSSLSVNGSQTDITPLIGSMIVASSIDFS